MNLKLKAESLKTVGKATKEQKEVLDLVLKVKALAPKLKETDTDDVDQIEELVGWLSAAQKKAKTHRDNGALTDFNPWFTGAHLTLKTEKARIELIASKLRGIEKQEQERREAAEKEAKKSQKLETKKEAEDEVLEKRVKTKTEGVAGKARTMEKRPERVVLFTEEQMIQKLRESIDAEEKKSLEKAENRIKEELKKEGITEGSTSSSNTTGANDKHMSRSRILKGEWMVEFCGGLIKANNYKGEPYTKGVIEFLKNQKKHFQSEASQRGEEHHTQ